MARFASGEEIILLAAAMAIAAARNMDVDTLNLLSIFFNAFGDNLGILAVQRAALEEQQPDEPPL